MISRRESLRRMTLLAASWGMPFSFVAASDLNAAPWINLEPEPVTAPGYGTDPDLLHPAPVPWPGTLTKQQRTMISTLADILIPAEGGFPSASDAGVVEVLDEWVSAPYPNQQVHRAQILSGLAWCDAQAQMLFAQPFTQLKPDAQLKIIDEIAFPAADDSQEDPAPIAFFSLLRALVTGMYYTSPTGVQQLGYQGNVPVNGDYPGPSREALQHLNTIKAELGLD